MTTDVTIILAATSLALFAAGLMAASRAWRDWIALKREELERRGRPVGEEKVEIAELKVRVRQLEAIAACVDL